MTEPGSVFVLGAGKVSLALVRALGEAKVPVLGLWARRAEAAREASAKTGVEAFSGELPEAMYRAQILLFAVKDEAITELATKVAEHEGGAKLGGPHRPIFLHCSGALASAEAFAGLEGLAGRAMLHPLQAIADPSHARFQNSYFGIEGDTRGRAAAKALCEALGAEALELAEADLPRYHAAAVMASNFTVALLDAAADLMSATSVPKELAQQALRALSEGALTNLRDKGLPGALTGPIRRGDSQTIARHLDAIDTYLPSAASLYVQAARWCLAMSEEIGEASQEELSEISRLLEKHSKPASS